MNMKNDKVGGKESGFVELDQPPESGWESFTVVLAEQARTEDGRGRSALVAANKHRIELGLTLLNHQPPKGKRGDATRMQWYAERAKELHYEERVVRYLISTAAVMSKSGLALKVPVEILDRNFKLVRGAVKRYTEHDDADWKAPKEDPAAGPEARDALMAKFSKAVEKARKLAAAAFDADPEDPFWLDWVGWFDSAPGMVRTVPDAKAGKTDSGKIGAAKKESAAAANAPGAVEVATPPEPAVPSRTRTRSTPVARTEKKVPIAVEKRKTAAVVKRGAKAAATAKPDQSILPKRTRVRLLSDSYAGCTGVIKGLSPKLGYDIGEIRDNHGTRVKRQSGDYVRAYMRPEMLRQTWEVLR